MFDFRYHLISLVAVFLALGIGVLLGVTIADSGVVSSAQRDLEQSLRGDLRDARSSAAQARSDLAHRDDFEQQIYPNLVSGLLTSRRIGLVAIGGLPAGVGGDVRDTVLPAHGTLSSISVVRSPLDLAALSGALNRSRFSNLKHDDASLSDFGQFVGRKLIEGGPAIARLRNSLLASRSGSSGPLDGVIYVRDLPDLTDRQSSKVGRFESAFMKGMTDTNVPVIGVEEESTDYSQVQYYRDHGLTTVDSIDQIAGRVSLVYALLGAKGNYGVKSTADQLLPQTLVNQTRSR